MKRTLFIRELRSALPPQLIALAIFLGGALVTEKAFHVQLANLGISLDFLVLSLFMLSAVLTGERCFSVELKDRRYFFLASLPLYRGWTWFCIVSARLLAGLLGLAAVELFLAARSPFWRMIKEIGSDSIPLLALLYLHYLFFFSIGASFSLLFRRLLPVFAAGSLCLIISSGLMLQWTLYGYSASSLSSPTTVTPDQKFYLLWYIGVLLVALSLIGLSWQFFIKGEFGSTKRLIRSSLCLVLTLSGALLLHLFITTDPGIARVGSCWIMRQPTFTWEEMVPQRPVSDEGHYVFMHESLSHRPRFSRITLLDTSTGRNMGRWSSSGVLWAGWVGDTLRFLTVNDSPWNHWGLPKATSVDLIDVGLDGRELWRRNIKNAQAFAPFPNAQRLLLVLRDKDVGKISLLDERLGTLEQLALGPLTGFASVQPAGEAWIVHFNNDPRPGKVWLVTSQARELVHDHGTYFYALFGNMYATLSEVEKALLKKFASDRKGSFILPDHSNAWFVESGQTLFFVEPDSKNGKEASTLWAVSTGSPGRWTRVTAGISSSDLRSLAIDFTTGFAAYIQRDHSAGLFLYDPALGQPFRIADGCTANEVGQISLKRFRSLKRPLVEVACREKNPGSASRRYSIEYQGLGSSKEVKHIPETGNLLYLDETDAKIWVLPDGHLWRSVPGSKDQLLWAPGSAS